jgi:hypothetical protein
LRVWGFAFLLEEKSEARNSQVRWKRGDINKRAPVMEKEERTGKGTTLRKKRNHKRERKVKRRGGRGREKQEPHPLMGEEIKRPPAGRGRPQDIAEGGERSEAKGGCLSPSEATNRQLPKIVFFFPPSTTIQHFGWKSSNSPLIFDHFF